MRRSTSRGVVFVLALGLALTGLPASAGTAAYEFETPVFGLSAGGGRTLFAADAGAGIVRLRGDAGRLLVELPGVTDVAAVEDGPMWAATSDRRNWKLYEIVRRTPRMVANLGKFERQVNPDEGIIESNPFDLAALGRRRVLVADAAANALLIADRRGVVDWVATFPVELVSTENAKTLAGCPDPPPGFEEICELPDEIPGEAVSTSVAVGPDGAFYVTELKGFPAPLGESRIWRIEPGTRNVHCDAEATDGPCTVVADGFTSIVDITFGPDGTAYVVELDEASWLAVELGPDAMAGGTVNACDPTTWTCTEAATGLTIPMAVAVNASGAFVLVAALIPGAAAVVPLG